jgi:xylose isomerase
MSADYFAAFDTIRYEGPDSTNDLAYRWYNKDRVILGKRMEDYLRFAVCFWHTFCWPGSDVFGAGTFNRPWPGPAGRSRRPRQARSRPRFVEKLDLPFYCFHDVDVMAPADGIADFRKSFALAVDHLEELQAKHGRKLLWGTANLFSHPRFMAARRRTPTPRSMPGAPAKCATRWKPRIAWAARTVLGRARRL